MMVFVVVYKGDRKIYEGQQIDGGNAAYKLAKEKGYQVRLWDMNGLNRASELDKDTKNEIKKFVRGLR